MANFPLQTLAGAPKDDQILVSVRRFLLGLALETLLLMALGSATRVMNAGLACPDWPLCYGELVPLQQMNLQVFLEWFHRLTASLVGASVLALTLFCWWKRPSLPPWLPWIVTVALFMVVLQGILGGLTVTELLRFDIVTAHLATALLFFSTLLTAAMLLTPYAPLRTAGNLPWWSGIAALSIYGQSLLGGLVASRWALHECFDTEALCVVMNSHILGVLPASLAALLALVQAWRTPALHPWLRRLSQGALGLFLLQVLLGVATFRLHLQVEPLTVAHQLVGAALLGCWVAMTVLALRDRQDSQAALF